MYRHTILFSTIVLLFASQVTADVHVDGRIAWVAAKNADNAARFMGSLRFADRPSVEEFRVLNDLGVQFFDYGRGRAGSRTIYPAKIPFDAVEQLKRLDFLVSVECARQRRTPPPLAQSRPQVEADQDG